MASRDGKTEAPTEKKKRDAKKKGTTAKSQDLASWSTLLVASYVLPATVAGVHRVLLRTMDRVGAVAEQPDPRAAVSLLSEALSGALFATLPLLGVCALVGVAATLAQTGLVLSLHPLKPDVKRINPLQGLKRLFSKKSLWETAKQVAKASAIAFVAWPHVMAVHEQLTETGRIPLLGGLAAAGGELVAMVRAVAWLVVGIALFDFAFQRRQKVLDLKMTKQEIRDEMKNSEGDPHVKGRIRSMQTALARNRMMASIPEATVVITNPTHVAVAIRYEAGAGGAPTVIATGVGAVALRIRERAIESGVPVVEAKPLARALWRACDVGDEIPVVLYEAVAKVLAFVRRLRGTLLAATATALPLPSSYRLDDAALDALPGRRNRRQLPAA